MKSGGTEMSMTKERMLVTLATLLRVYVESGRRIAELEVDLEDGAVKAIRDLILNRPKVSKEFVEKWAEKFDDLPSSYFDAVEPRKSIITMLCEAGVIIQGECDKSHTLINKCKAIDTKGRP